ncbi:MAG TPA: hypothetical protein VJU18_09900, partial [Vicinamibacteria bacterium]|nr:hypothetical protein [Vicinamibacteria bacterium]
PKGLKPATTLEITDPNGVVLSNQNLTFHPAVDPNADPADYSITWAGPWTTDPNNPKSYLYLGNYRIVVKGVSQDDSPLESAPYDKVSLVEVKKVELAECGSAGLPSCQDGGVRLAENEDSNGNPMPGGGKAAFPDGTEPTQTQPNPDYRRTVLLRAELEPNLGPDAGQVTVHFRSIDVDDPSAQAAGSPIDDDTVATSSADNRNETATLVTSATASPDQGGAAITYLKVSTQQENNYRLAASTHEPWLATLCGVVSSGDGAVQKTPCSPGVPAVPLPSDDGRQVSDMLTVWRTLHLEVDALVSQDPAADQAAMDIRDNHTRLWRNRLRDDSRPFFDGGHPNRDDWVGANVSLGFHASDWYDATDNTDRDVRVNVATGQPDLLNGQRDRDITDRSYILRDDEIASLDRSQSCGPTTCVADYSLATDIFARAYIRLLPVVQFDVDATIPFVIVDHRNITSNFSLPNQVPSSRTFWATHLVSAFDGNAASDLDPRPLRGSFAINLGLTTVGAPLNDGRHKLKSTVFIETIRDTYEKPPTGGVGGAPLVLSPEVNRRVTAHEILHTFGIVHDAPIMCAEINIQNNTVGGTVTDDHIHALRSAERPVMPPHNDPCP